MQTDDIEAVGIDNARSLWVKPATATFPYIYREAMEVQWDPKRVCLYSPKPREWSYIDWFAQIRAAALNQGVDLRIGPATAWIGVDPELRRSFEQMA